MNYTTYFTRGQKVFLINTSPERDNGLFEAFSATITEADNTRFVLCCRYPLQHADLQPLKPGMRFKVTAESYGSGVQFSGSVHSVSGSTFVIHPANQIEMYQRSQVPRMDTIINFRVFTRSAPLGFFRQEWEHYRTLLTSCSVDKLELESGEINLGVGGLRYLADQAEKQSVLAMVFISLEPDTPPVCAVAELLWRRTLPDDELSAIGRRFVLIQKSDQERIQTYIQRHQKKIRKKAVRQKNNWELLDRMFYE